MPASEERPPILANSDAWKSYLRPWLRRRIEHLRDELERPGQNVEEYRGRIAELRDLIRKADPDEPEPGTAGVYFQPGE
jgi:hypothetical protein